MYKMKLGKYILFKKISLWLIYMIFASYIIYLAFTTPQLIAKAFFLITGIFVLATVFYYDYLKSLYSKMIAALTMETDIPKAHDLKRQLQKKDIFKGFKHSLILFDSLLLIDEGAYEACILHMEKHEKFFRSSLDNLFIYYHNHLHCYYLLGKNKDAKSVIKKIVAFKEIKSNQYSPLFSWEEINGIAYFLDGRNKKSIQSFNEVPINQLNAREKTYLNFMFAESYRQLRDFSKVGEYMSEMRKYSNTLSISRREKSETF